MLKFREVAEFDMNLEDWKQLCRKAWEDEYEYLQLDRFTKIGEGSKTTKNCNKTNYIECTPETNPLWLTKTLYSI